MSTLTRKNNWITAAILAFLIHLIFLFAIRIWRTVQPPFPKAQPIETIDANKLEEMRRRLLLTKDTHFSEKAPENATAESDRNRVVPAEQQARKTDILPERAKSRGQQGEEGARAQAPAVPSLKAFGLSLPRTAPAMSGSPGATRSQGESDSFQDQTLLDRSLPYGSENLLNTKESIYYSFYSRIYETIGPMWRSELSSIPRSRGIPDGDYITVVEVVLDSEGNLLEVLDQQLSGIPAFDESVRSAWQRVRKFPNPPKGLLNLVGEVRMGWSFHVRVSPGAGWQFAPPSREF